MNTHHRWIVIANALIAALLGVLTAQVLHEACHGLAAVLVGAEWQAFNLFAVLWAWPGAANETGALIIEANPALINILTGLLAAFLFTRPSVRQHSMLSLYLMYFAGYSIFMGFGYLLIDPLFYQSGGENLGDWKKVIDMLGGSWAVRLPLLLVGAAGTMWGFFWLAGAAMRFAKDATDKSERQRVALPLLLIPYFTINILFTIFSLWHPMGPEGIVVVVFQYWFGYIGFFWAFFFAAYWLNYKTPYADARPLPDKVSVPWAVAAGIALFVAAAILLPTVTFV